MWAACAVRVGVAGGVARVGPSTSSLATPPWDTPHAAAVSAMLAIREVQAQVMNN